MHYECRMCGENHTYPFGRDGDRFCVHCSMAINRVIERQGGLRDVVAEELKVIKRHLQDQTGFVVPAVVVAVMYIDFMGGVTK